ncbi:MAG: 2TM domain-containing protein [Candidatus Dormibacteria bacterium]
MSVTTNDLRQLALKQLQERRDFVPHLLAYVLVNAGLVLVWAVTSRTVFWPGFVLVFWGVGLVIHAWSAFFRRPITEDEVERYMARLSGRAGGPSAG